MRIDIISRWVAGYLGIKPPARLADQLKRIWPIDAGPMEPWSNEIVAPGSTMASAIRAAALWGYNPIYLVGCDGGYEDGEINHFDAKYDEHNTGGRPAEKFNELLDTVFEISYRECQQRGIQIYNATRGSKIKGIPIKEPFK